MNPFEAAPEFVGWDNRQSRPHSPVSVQQMLHKHEVLFPASLVRDKTVLDIGSALGATGHWCLSMGARAYTGLETQETYAERSRELMQKYHPGKSTIIRKPIETYFSEDTEVFDIVSLLGVLYVFVDYYSILKDVCARARETIVIESLYPFGSYFRKGFTGVQFLEQDINLAGENSSLQGRGTRISPAGLQFIMRDFGFESKEGQLYPKPITESLDVYNSMKVIGPRFLLRFTRTGAPEKNLSQDLSGEQTGTKKPWSEYL